MEYFLLTLSMVGALLLLGVVAVFVVVITRVIDHFGASKDCDLAKICWGLRAIEKETAVLPRDVPQLNQELAAVRDGLLAIDRSLVTAAQSQR